MSGLPVIKDYKTYPGSTRRSSPAIERFNRWPEAIPPPDVITWDRGSQFTNRFWSKMNKLLARHNTTAYNPIANGMAKRMHRSLMDALRAGLPKTSK